jgi:very-short-patch-repair endonuclease
MRGANSGSAPLVEIDGDHHDRARTKRDDRIQDAVLQANGFVVLRFREEHLDRPEDVLRRLAAYV